MSDHSEVPSRTADGISGKKKGKDTKTLKIFNKPKKQETPSKPATVVKNGLTFVEVWSLIIKKALRNSKNLIGFFLINALRLILELIALKEKHYPPKKNKKDPIRRSFSNSNFNRLVNSQVRNGFIREKPYTLVIEMEGFLYCHSQKKPTKCSYKEFKSPSSKPSLKGETHYIVKRPFVDYFLQELTDDFHIIIFTVLEKKIADQIIEYIDPKKLISLKIYQDSCIKHPKGLIKDLSVLGNDFSDAVMIDHSEQAISLNRDNAFCVDKWEGDEEDFQLESLARMLKEMPETGMGVEEFVYGFKE